MAGTVAGHDDGAGSSMNDPVQVQVRRKREQRPPEEIDAECLKLVLAEIANNRRGDQTVEETLAYLAEATSRWLHEHYLPRLRRRDK
jgi:hypothetical protein